MGESGLFLALNPLANAAERVEPDTEVGGNVSKWHPVDDMAIVSHEIIVPVGGFA